MLVIFGLQKVVCQSRFTWFGAVAGASSKRTWFSTHTWDSLVQGLADLVRNKGQGSTSVGDSLVTGLRDLLAGDGRSSGIKHPEALGVVNVCVVNFVTANQIGVNVAESVEGVGGLVARGVEGRCEKLRIRRNIALRDHVGNWGVLRGGFAVLADSVNGRPGETEQAVASAGDELISSSLGQLNGLVLNLDATNVHNISANISRCRAAISVRDLPSLASGLLPGGRFGGVENVMILLVLSCELGREYLLQLASIENPQCTVATYPKIRGASVEIQLECLGWSADLHFTQILSVILLVFRSHLAGLAVRSGSNELVLTAKTTAAGNIGVGKATLVQVGGVTVGTGLGWLKAETVQEVDIGFRAMCFVVLVGDSHDLLQA